ncbi:hypothetical protein KDX16_32135 [Burkholderia vietnamiensis]|jgi:hypothetical protein|uniref:Uncharacterized protein n=2 Tax=Burkholderia cepacia complex TaxID=87882 RepID=A0A228HLL7_9BURK|nr:MULTISPECIES: hypothetical protein [Burkholderia]HDR9758741.1 hypothetical protein [Burkholderia cepacia ATCC 25416]MBR7920448.1 hypothetical protein [Burkholderia vietnamiensis]MBR8054810.1 hypothetical protein [Burkholderia vietnamiensis]MDN7570116.1 hypothetical protein [Burkholderia contaminans]OXI31094.1 hypothetical protein CFB84_42625 [Burkholderia aenigmatica]
MPRPLENPERKGDESLFSLALNARCEYALMRLRVVAGEIGSPAFKHHLAEANRLAARAGYLYAREPIPTLLRDAEELEDAWNDGVKKCEEERRAAGEQIRRPDIEKLIDEKDWYALGLPFPEQILWSLKRGDRVLIRWHFLTPNVNSVTYGNPYRDAALFGTLDDLSVEDLDVLLSDIARGRPWRRVRYRSRE